MENMVEGIGGQKFFKGKNILITGASGFKGSWLSSILQSFGAQVIGYSLVPESKNNLFTSSKLEDTIHYNYYENICDSEKLNEVFQKHEPEIVFHLAAQALVRSSYKDPKLTYESNVLGSVNILEAVRNCESVKSLIYVTSDKAYANQEWIWGYRENDELGGHDPYSASKAAAEIIFHSYLKSYFSDNGSIGIASVRAGNVIGGGDWAEDRIIPDCISALSDNKTIKIRNPIATRPWQHVLEPLSGYLLLAQRLYQNPTKYCGSWNFGPSSSSICNVEKLVKSIIKFWGDGSYECINDDNAVHEASLLHLNCDKANQLLSWYPKWDLNETLQRTVDWYKNNIEYGKPTTELILNDIKNYFK